MYIVLLLLLLLLLLQYLSYIVSFNDDLSKCTAELTYLTAHRGTGAWRVGSEGDREWLQSVEGQGQWRMLLVIVEEWRISGQILRSSDQVFSSMTSQSQTSFLMSETSAGKERLVESRHTEAIAIYHKPATIGRYAARDQHLKIL